jgi:oxygen-independent coproporphyrinogen-3 oxidase
MNGAGFGIYIHWPFCLSKCPYCDFNSHAAAAIDQARWRAALLAECAWFRRHTGAQAVTSIFFGGGTPSLMEPATAGALIEAIHRLWPVATGAEITLEANPTSVEAGRFRDFRAAGVNRLSLGVQALDEAALRFLGRRHDRAEALAALDLARRVFPRFSFDLIYARPGQTAAAWRAELAEALALAGGHLSLYQLTIEDGTAFARRDIALPGEDESAALFEATQEMTEAAGLPAYEVSNHARSGEECRHNLVYWLGGDYVGVGPGAHGRLAGEAWRQHRTPDTWLAAVERDGHGTKERVTLDPAVRAEERVMMGLRLSAGIDWEVARTVVDGGALARMEEGGFVELVGGRLRVTAAGRLVLNAVTAELLG